MTITAFRSIDSSRNFVEKKMIVDFSALPDSSRVWIYQADREFSEAEMPVVKKRLNDFVEKWTSHSKEVKAGFDIRYNRFIIIALDESHVPAGGCSIDSSMHTIQAIEKDFQNPLTNRMNFAFKENGVVKTAGRTEFESLTSAGKIDSATIVFNNLVSLKSELASQWEIPLHQSWHKQLFPVRN